MPPLNNSGKTPQTAQEYAAVRQSDRFFCDVKGRAAGILELADAKCFTAVVDAVSIMVQEVEIEQKRRTEARVKQLELDGLAMRSGPDSACFSTMAEFMETEQRP